jgi:transcriptional regulator with XRE-family HTH domain
MVSEVVNASGAAPARGADLGWAGRRLRELREARGVSQSELARRTGSPRTYVIAIEQGKHEPSLELLGRIAAALGYDLRDVLWALVGEPFADPGAPLAARVRLRRERLGLRAAELAERAGTTRATISQIESGTNANPGLGLLARLAAALHCCPSELAPPRAASATPGTADVSTSTAAVTTAAAATSSTARPA